MSMFKYYLEIVSPSNQSNQSSVSSPQSTIQRKRKDEPLTPEQLNKILHPRTSRAQFGITLNTFKEKKLYRQLIQELIHNPSLMQQLYTYLQRQVMRYFIHINYDKKFIKQLSKYLSNAAIAELAENDRQTLSFLPYIDRTIFLKKFNLLIFVLQYSSDFLTKDSEAIKYISTFPKDFVIRIIQQLPWIATLLPNPTKEMILTAVAKNSSLIEHFITDVNNVDKNFLLEIVKVAPEVVEKLPLQLVDEELQLEAVKRYPHLLSGLFRRYIFERRRYFPNFDISKRAIIEALKRDGELLKDVPSSKRDENIILAAIRQEPTAIRFVSNPSIQAQLEAVKKDPKAIAFIDNPPKEVQMEAVKRDPWSVSKIKNPDKEVQMEAIKRDKETFILIHRRLHPEVRDLYFKLYPSS